MNDDEKLRAHGIRLTTVRQQVWQAILQQKGVFSMVDIENVLVDMDESSVFRTLRTFAKANLIHEVNDGTETCKYCVCTCEESHHQHHHLHFHCECCGKTFCLENIMIPPYPIPEGFEVNYAEFILKGKCPECARKI